MHGYVTLEMYVQGPALLVLTVVWLMVFCLPAVRSAMDVSRIRLFIPDHQAVVAGTFVLFLLTLDVSNPRWKEG